MARDKQMAAIKAALEQEPHRKTPIELPDVPTLPIVEDTKEEKAAKREQEKSAREQLKEQTRLQAARITKESQERGEEQSNKLVQTLQNLSGQVQNLWKGTQVQLENIPTPGSLLLPFVILMVFFFLLLPVNGHTRFIWLWLVLTGQAEISATSGGGGQEAPPAQPTAGELPSSNVIQPQLGTFATYASEVV